MTATRGLLVRAGHVLTAADPAVVPDGAVRVVDGRIAAVGPWAELRATHPDDEVRGTPHDLLTPGFVNAHGHFSEGLITGIAEHATLWEWIGCLIAPVAPHLDAAMARSGTLLAGIQMLRTGVTTANDMFVYDPSPGVEPITPQVVEALEALGMRGVVSFGAGDVRGQDHALVDREHDALQAACEASRRQTFRVGVGAVGAQSPALFARSVRRAVDGGHGVHIHLQEIREEVTATVAAHGVTPVGLCAREGLFAAPTLAAHCVWVDHADRELLAAHGVAVSHNPVANMILASGAAPVAAMRRMGIPVGIGVDGAASNDRQDYLEALKSAVLLARVTAQQATAMSARDAFTMATIEGARALGLDHEVGSIEVGKAADLVLLDGSSPALANIHDPFQALVYVAGPREVRDVWVDGHPVLVDGHVTGADVSEVVARSRPLARRLARLAGLGDLSILAHAPSSPAEVHA